MIFYNAKVMFLFYLLSSRKDACVLSQRKIVTDLTEGPVASTLIAFAIPFMFANLFQTLYSLVDMIIVGQYVGSVGLSAVSVGGEVTQFFMFLSMGIAGAGQVIISQYIGRKDYENLNSFIGTLFTFLIAVAVLMTIIGLCHAM